MQIIELEMVARDGIEPSTRGFPGFALRLEGAKFFQGLPVKPQRLPSILLAVTILCGGCAHAPAPLKPDHGYPADWPQLVALSEGLTELNGIYTNLGVATTVDGKLVPVALADLVPRTMPQKKSSAEPDLDCEQCVAIRVLPPKGEILTGPKLRFTLASDSDVRVFDAPALGNADATRYTLQSFVDNAIVGFAFNSTDVTLTCASDASLVAKIHKASGILLLLLIPVSSEEEIWARFERIGDLAQPIATDADLPTPR
jgi:hypothetical protein